MTIKAGVFLNLSKNNMGSVSELKTDDVSVDAPEASPTEALPVLDEPNYFVDESPEITVPTPENEDVYSYDLTNEQEEIMAQINKVQNEQFDYEQYVINQFQEELDMAKEELQE